MLIFIIIWIIGSIVSFLLRRYVEIKDQGKGATWERWELISAIFISILVSWMFTFIILGCRLQESD